VKCLASENGYSSPPDDDEDVPAKRHSPWDDVFEQDSENSLEDGSVPCRLSSLPSSETPKTLAKRQRSQPTSCVTEKTGHLLSVLRSRVSQSLSENKRLSGADKDKDLGALLLQVQKLINENADPLVKDGNGIRALQYLVILCDCPPFLESFLADASSSVMDDAILGGNFLDLCLASKRARCVETMVTAGMTPMLPPLYRSCCVVRRLKLMLAIDANTCNLSMSLCEVCASFFSSRMPLQTSCRSKWSDTAELAPSILSFLARSKRSDLVQTCTESLAELCTSGELGVFHCTFVLMPHCLTMKQVVVALSHGLDVRGAAGQTFMESLIKNEAASGCGIIIWSETVHPKHISVPCAFGNIVLMYGKEWHWRPPVASGGKSSLWWQSLDNIGRSCSAVMALICAGARPWGQQDLGDSCACPSWARAMARNDVALAMALIVTATSSQKIVLLQCAKELYRWDDRDLKKLTNMVSCISE